MPRFRLTQQGFQGPYTVHRDGVAIGEVVWNTRIRAWYVFPANPGPHAAVFKNRSTKSLATALRCLRMVADDMDGT
jgi:hypothetical protein